MESNITKDTVKESIKKSAVISRQFHYVTIENSESLVADLSLILEEIKKPYMKEPIGYFVREFVSNANKSNLKKIHFQQLGLDMKDSDTYYEGMKTFAKDFREKLDLYSSEVEKKQLYTGVDYQVKDNILSIVVRNSGTPTPQEAAKVMNLVEKSKTIRDAAEAFMLMGDMSEGAGMGVILAMLMLRSLGLDEKSFQFVNDRQKKETIVKVNIPLSTLLESQMEEISDVIAKELDLLPTFPEKINHLQKLLSTEEEIDFNKVAEVIQSDFALTAELLKIVNSAQYMLPQKVSNISNAISLVGIKGLKNLIISYGAQDILKRHFGVQDKLWEHSYRCASYAYFLAKDYKMKEIMDDAYISGILHDIGKIIVVQKYPKLDERIRSYCADKGIKGNLIENTALGASHAKIGAEMVKKWNFPEFIVNSIQFHHQPLLCPDEYTNIVYVVYLANLLTHIHEKAFSFANIDRKVLDLFSLKNERDIIDLEKRLDGYYFAQKSKGQDNNNA